MELTKTIAKTFGRFKHVPFLPILLDEQMKIYTLFFRPAVFTKMIELTQWIKELEGVSTKYHKYGGIEFVVNDKEICHMHGDGLVDIKLNKQLKKEFIGREGIEDHHVMQMSNMISYQLKKTNDLAIIQEVILKAYNRIAIEKE